MSPTSPILSPNRTDERVVQGRAERTAETYFVVPGAGLVNTSTVVAVADRDVYSPWMVSTPIVVDQLAFEVTALVAGNARVGFYRADRDWQPFGAPLADSGDISTGTTGVKTYTPSTPIVVRPGRYLSVINANVAPTIRIFRGGFGVLDDGLAATGFLNEPWVTRSYAAFQTPGSPWDSHTLSSNPVQHRVVYRLSQP